MLTLTNIHIIIKINELVFYRSTLKHVIVEKNVTKARDSVGNAKQPMRKWGRWSF